MIDPYLFPTLQVLHVSGGQRAIELVSTEDVDLDD